MQRTQVEDRLSHPVRQCRTIELNTLAGVNLRLPVEWQVIGIFGDQDLGNGGLGRQTALDQPGRAGACTTPSSQARQAYLGRRVTRLRNCAGTRSSRSLLSSPIRCNSPLATGAGLIVDIDDDLDPRQVRRQGATVAAALASPRLTAFRRADVMRRLAIRRDLLDVFKAQQHLIFGQRLCAQRPNRCRCSSLMI
ncbi:hypothetical protein ACVWYH_007224 [Bradyrhizobium sp. GM24.11]